MRELVACRGRTRARLPNTFFLPKPITFSTSSADSDVDDISGEHFTLQASTNEARHDSFRGFFNFNEQKFLVADALP